MAEPTLDTIYEDGRHYDLLFPHADPTFLIEQAVLLGGPVLELACGTGRLTIPLAQAELDVTGIDRSSAMLAHGVSKAAALGIHVEWIEADMRDFSLPRQFSCIILVSNALWHLHDRESFRQCMRSVRTHLKPGGRFLLSLYVPDLNMLLEPETQRTPFAEYDDPDGRGRIVVTQTARYESDTQIRRVRTFQNYPWLDQEVEGRLDLRMYFPQELDALLEDNGFTIEEKLDEHHDPFGPSAREQFYILRVTTR
jgi:SAM-dependent methyltransferase